MSKVILGVDGGATKSHLAVFDENGNCLGATEYGALNHEVMPGSYGEFETKFCELLPQVLSDAGKAPQDVAFAVFGLAGVDTKKQVEIMTDIVRKIGINNFIMCNDAFLGVPAGSPSCIGICAINGTGFKLAAIDYSGALLDTCGLGSFTDDRGGGSWYGFRTCSEVYNGLHKLGRPTIMRDMLFELFGISTVEEYLDFVANRIHDYRSWYGNVALNSIPFDAAALGDAVALDILDESAIQYAGAIAWLAMSMVFPQNQVLNVTLAGSVFVKQKVKILHELIEKRVADVLGNREIVYTCLDTPPVTGAVLLAAQKAGFNINPAYAKDELNKAFGFTG